MHFTHEIAAESLPGHLEETLESRGFVFGETPAQPLQITFQVAGGVITEKGASRKVSYRAVVQKILQRGDESLDVGALSVGFVMAPHHLDKLRECIGIFHGEEVAAARVKRLLGPSVVMVQSVQERLEHVGEVMHPFVEGAANCHRMMV
jgi:hypothetical protein